MRVAKYALLLAMSVLACGGVGTKGAAQSSPTEQDIIEALLGLTGGGEAGKGVTVSGGEVAIPSINLKVNFAFNSARLDNESLLTLDTLGRALSSDALEGQVIEIVGHTDASGSMEYNDQLSERRAGAVVDYLLRKFSIEPDLLAWRGMGERQLLDVDDPESGINRRVEIRNVTRAP